jgi:uncharacterized protein YcbX
VITVTGLAVTPVKATRLRTVQEVSLGPDGAVGNRRFYLVDEQGQMINSKMVGSLQAVVADYEPSERRLALTFPDGRVVGGPVSYAGTVATEFFSVPREARLVDGPWSEAISRFVGRSLRLVEADGDGAGVDRGRNGGVTLISRASLDCLASVAQTSSVDPRRFRMLIEIDGVVAHEEDRWAGHRVRIGEASIRFRGHVGRCLITSRDPNSGEVDLPTLDILRRYRGDAVTTEPLPFGIYGEVLAGGIVRVGDEVAPL